MDIRKLEAFCKVYELQSFSKAGEAIYLSQPTISSHIANLEEELGVRLFDRMGRTILPTEAGNVLYDRARSVFENIDEAKAAIEVLKNRVVGELRIGCSTIPSHNILPKILADFSNTYPEVCFSIHTGDSSEIIKLVSEGALPVGIVGEKPSSDDLEHIVIAQDETMIVGSANASWLPDVKEVVSMDTLAKLPWIIREKGSATRKKFEDSLGSIGRSFESLNVRCRVEGTCESLAHAVNGVGICFTSRLAAHEMIERGDLVQLNVPELEGIREFYLIYHKERHIFPALKAFVDFNDKLQSA